MVSSCSVTFQSPDSEDVEEDEEVEGPAFASFASLVSFASFVSFARVAVQSPAGLPPAGDPPLAGSPAVVAGLPIRNRAPPPAWGLYQSVSVLPLPSLF